MPNCLKLKKKIELAAKSYLRCDVLFVHIMNADIQKMLKDVGGILIQISFIDSGYTSLHKLNRDRQVTAELDEFGIYARWSNTHGEHSHAKLLLAEYRQGKSVVILGSVNFTRLSLNHRRLLYHWMERAGMAAF